MRLAGLLVLCLLAGCAAPAAPPSPAAPDAGAPLAEAALGEPLGIDGGEVVERGAGNATLVWRGTTADGVARTTLRLPSDVDLRVRAELSRMDAGRLRVSLYDSDGVLLCAGSEGVSDDVGYELERAVEGTTGCTFGNAPSTSNERAWTVQVDPSFRGTPSPTDFEVTVEVFAHPPVGPARLDRIVPLEVEAPDGVVLRGHAYVPTGAAPFDTILLYSPYWGAPDRGSDEWEMTVDGERSLRPSRGIDALLQAGYAVALVNIRGTGASDGCYQYMHQPQNGRDANLVIDAIAAQPWSSGDVGMYGLSYPGATQYAAIAFGPSPHLKAVVPVSGEWNMWNMVGNSYGAMGVGATVHAGHRNREQGLGVTLPPYGGPSISTLRPEHWCETTSEPELAFSQFALDGDNKGWFAERDLRDELAGKQVPFFATFGLGDDGHILQVNDLWELMPTPRRFMVGDWGHSYPTGDPAWFTRQHALPWFDHWMRGGPEVPTERVEYLDDAGAWRVASSWPPEGARVKLRLSDIALVAEPAQARASERRLANDDANAGTPRCDAPDRAVFATPPLAEDVVLAGNFWLDLPLEATAPNGNVAGTLWAVEGDACAGDGRFLQRAVSDLRHRGHLEMGEDFPIGAPADVNLTSVPLAKRVLAGERLVLVVGAGHADFVPKPFQPVLTLRTGPDVPADLTLLVVEGTLRFEGT